MSTLENTAEQRTYGGWIRPRTFGITVWRCQLGAIGTLLLFASIFAASGVLLFGGGLVPATLTCMVGLAVVGVTSWTNDAGRTIAQRTGAGAAFLHDRATGRNRYRSGPIASSVGTFRLPGLLRRSELHEAMSQVGAFALLHVPQTRTYTVVLAADPDGAALVDLDQVNGWVAHYGVWLASLGREPQLEAASVTIETAPDSGNRLRAAVDARLDAEAPEVARAMIRESVEAAPVGASAVRAYVALTFASRTRRGQRHRGSDEMARDLSTRVPYLAAALQQTGAGYVRPVDAAAMCELVRTAYDPQAASAFDEARRAGIAPGADWANVGPTGTHATWGTYQHDTGHSITWEMVAPPRGVIASSTLDAILRPHPDVDRKRVTFHYKPISPARAGRLVEQQRDRALSRQRAARKASARVDAELRRAEQAAHEEAFLGAGLVSWSLYVTATVTDPARLELARLAVEQAAPAARLTLRVAGGAQADTFAAALPVGIVLSQHVRVPAVLRGAL